MKVSGAKTVDDAIQALKWLGFADDEILCDTEHIPYKGKARDADVVIRRRVFGGFGDLGVVDVDEGIEILIDDIDIRSALMRHAKKHSEYDLDHVSGFDKALAQFGALASGYHAASELQDIDAFELSQDDDGRMRLHLELP